MANPYLPLWEYIPDGEPRVFGDRVYIYGSHDRAGSDKFCDTKLKVWSASVDNLNEWVCHGDIFHTESDRDHIKDTEWTSDNYLYAPDVVKKGDKYYLYAYIMGTLGCVAESDRPEGPFKLISKYKYEPVGKKGFDGGWFVDPGVLVDNDGRVYIYCGFEHSFAAEINPDNMYEIIPGTYVDGIIPDKSPFSFFEACSIRKIGKTYYLIYSPRQGNRLVYATSDKPLGPYNYRGIIVDNGDEYPAGNNHGSICCIKGQWYIFYHRMTNGTIMSRRDCVEKITILDDGTIPQVKMTSLGFESALNPYRITKAETACVLLGEARVTERNVFTRYITSIKENTIIGYRYFDFGDDYNGKTMKFCAKVRGNGMNSVILIFARPEEEDSEAVSGKSTANMLSKLTPDSINKLKGSVFLGECTIGLDSGVYEAVIKNVTGRQAIYFAIHCTSGGWFRDRFDGRLLFELEEFVFLK